MNYAKPETVRKRFKDSVPNILVMMMNSAVEKGTIHLFFSLVLLGGEKEPCATGGIEEIMERDLKFWRFIQGTKSLLQPFWSGPTVSQGLNIGALHFCSGKRNFIPFSK